MTERAASLKSADAYRTISEVADDLGLPQHVLRFWETRFPQVKPLKRAGGRRFYRPEDVDLLRAVKVLLYDAGYTIRGVQRMLREQGPRSIAALPGVGSAFPPDDQVQPAAAPSAMDLVPRASHDAPVPASFPQPDSALVPWPDISAAPSAIAGGAGLSDIVSRLRSLLAEFEACEHLLAARSATPDR